MPAPGEPGCRAGVGVAGASGGFTKALAHPTRQTIFSCPDLRTPAASHRSTRACSRCLASTSPRASRSWPSPVSGRPAPFLPCPAAEHTRVCVCVCFPSACAPCMYSLNWVCLVSLRLQLWTLRSTYTRRHLGLGPTARAQPPTATNLTTTHWTNRQPVWVARAGQQRRDQGVCAAAGRAVQDDEQG